MILGTASCAKYVLVGRVFRIVLALLAYFLLRRVNHVAVIRRTTVLQAFLIRTCVVCCKISAARIAKRDRRSSLYFHGMLKFVVAPTPAHARIIACN